MEECFEYLGCNKKDCIMHGRRDNTCCWEAEGTLCNNNGIELVRNQINGNKEDACVRSGCIYYKAAKNRK